MRVNYWNQPQEIKLGEVLIQRLEENFDKMWFVSGFTKDSGIESLMEAIEKSPITEKNMDLGIDKKNTSKDMLLKLLNAKVNLRVFLNGSDSKVETRVYVFAKKEGNSYVYLSAGKLSEGGLWENGCLVTEIIYEADEYKELEKLLQKIKKNMTFQKTKEEDVRKLAEKGEVMARIVERKIPRISELYQQGNIEIGERQYDENVGLGMKKEIYHDVDIAVDLPKE